SAISKQLANRSSKTLRVGAEGGLAVTLEAHIRIQLRCRHYDVAGLKVRMPVRSGRRDRRDHLPQKLIEALVVVNPAHDNDQVVLPVQIHRVDAVALERHRRARRRWKRKAVFGAIRSGLRVVQEPVTETIAGIGW